MTANNKFFGRIKNAVIKPFVFIRNKTGPARDLMRSGRAGGMILEMALAVLMSSWVVNGYTYDKMPYVICIMVTADILVILAELIALVFKLLFGSGRRSTSYFYTAFVLIAFLNLVGNLLESVLPAVIMSFLLVLSFDILGRCIWGLVAGRRFKQVFVYLASFFAIAYIGAYAFFMLFDGFGGKRIDHYLGMTEPVTMSQAEGFDTYLEEGPYEVLSLSYGPEDTADIQTDSLDYTIFDSVQQRGGFAKITDIFCDYDLSRVPVKGQIWYPAELTDRPVFFMVHGNHDSTVPSYLGYEYLGRYLASNGYVVISVDENIINATGEGNDKRAILLLDNMKAIFELNKTEGSKIYDLIDEDRVALGGHSRGGEMVATAYLFNSLDSYPEDGNIRFDYNFNITSIVAIAPCVDQYMPVSHSVEIEDVNYLLIHGANDQDVSTMMGEKQYNNITFTADSAGSYLKSSVYILGANHGQFNSLWGRYDAGEFILNSYLNTNGFLDEQDQKLIARAYIRVFLDTTLNCDMTYSSLLQDVSGYSSYLPDTVYITNYSDSDTRTLASFDDTVDITGTGGNCSIDCLNSDTWTIEPYGRGAGGEAEDYVLDIKWEEGKDVQVIAGFDPVDISEGYISFAMADMREDTEDLQEPLAYSVELTDICGNTVCCDEPCLVYHSLALQLAKQDAVFGTYEYKHQLQTIRVSPSAFAEGSFDYSNVVSVKITIDGQEEGELILDDISYKEG